jgi:hypothetical protein
MAEAQKHRKLWRVSTVAVGRSRAAWKTAGESSGKVLWTCMTAGRSRRRIERSCRRAKGFQGAARAPWTSPTTLRARRSSLRRVYSSTSCPRSRRRSFSASKTRFSPLGAPEP